MGGRDGQDRAAALDATARELLAAGNTPGARHAAWHETGRVMAALHRADPAAAALADAWLAGALSAIAEALPARRPRNPPGYHGGPPSAAHLIAAYETARAETGRQQGRQIRDAR